MALLHLIDFDEPFGLSVVEAMACGTPVIAFDRGSMSEIIDDGMTGSVVADVAFGRRSHQGVGQLDRQTVRDEASEDSAVTAWSTSTSPCIGASSRTWSSEHHVNPLLHDRFSLLLSHDQLGTRRVTTRNG